MAEHLVVIIDKNKQIEPKLYSCDQNEKNINEAVSSAKKAYESKYKNYEYDSYYFNH